MPLPYRDINEVIRASGLRLVLVQGMPSAWGVAARAMIEYKSLEYTLGAQLPMGNNSELVAWAGTNSGPVVAWNDESPLNRWNDILLLLERLAPDKPLIPTDPAHRIQLFGIGHEICGELGFGWNRRLGMMGPVDPTSEPSAFALKYRYREEEARLADERAIAFMATLAELLKSQKSRGSNYLVGETVTAADFYWAAFSNFVLLQSSEDILLNPAVRPMFERTTPAVLDAVDPILIEHRNRIMQSFFTLPLAL